MLGGLRLLAAADKATGRSVWCSLKLFWETVLLHPNIINDPPDDVSKPWSFRLPKSVQHVSHRKAFRVGPLTMRGDYCNYVRTGFYLCELEPAGLRHRICYFLWHEMTSSPKDHRLCSIHGLYLLAPTPEFQPLLRTTFVRK